MDEGNDNQTAPAGDTQLAETQAKLSTVEDELAKLKAQVEQDKQFSTELVKATKFCEGQRQQLGTVPLEKAALALAHANVHCPAIEFEGQSFPFGEFVQSILSELPKAAPPAGLQIITGGKDQSKTREFADDDWSDKAIDARCQEYMEEHDCSYAEAYEAIGKLAKKKEAA